MNTTKLILLTASLVGMTFWGCSSNLDSGGNQGGESTLADATTKGISNCLTCHNPSSSLIQAYMGSRHGNHLDVTGKLALIDPDDTDEIAANVTDVGQTKCANECHDPFDDASDVDLTWLGSLASPANTDWSADTSIVGCEACHGGGQFHNGVPAGIPFAVPGPEQCGECHGATLALAEAGPDGSHHLTVYGGGVGGSPVWRNIMDSHYDNPLTSYDSSQLAASDPLFADNIVEGYAIRYEQQTGCVDCHFNGHAFDLTKNYQWAKSGHAGAIKTLKTAALATSIAASDDSAVTLATVTAVGPDADNAVFPHYDWDNTETRGSCQVCHTATGIANFLTDPTGYDTTGAGNDFSHLVGWHRANDQVRPAIEFASSGQNELLYCWGCHLNSTGALRNPGAIPLDYTYDSVTVTIPDVTNSNVCVKCHGGRGNNDTIRTASRSSRGAEHHAPTAGSVFAANTHAGYEFEGVSYVNAAFQHSAIDTSDTGPCVTCHMTSENHTFSAVVYTSGEISHQDITDPIATIRNLAACNVADCHDGAASAVMAAATLQTQKEGFEDAKTLLAALMSNATTNYLGLNISTTSNNNYRTVPLNAYGAFQNNVYMSEDPCAYVHNDLYAKRLIFDSIDWMDNGALDSTIDMTGYADGAAWIEGAVPADITAVARP